MQRQSLGSPVSKLHTHTPKDDIISSDDTKARRFSSSSLTSPLSSSSLKPEKLIHLIPLLTLLCFLVLYLASHSPSQSDLAQFNGFKLSSKLADSAGTNDVSEIGELRRGDVLAIRSLRNLRGIADEPKSRWPRKIADF